MAIPEEIPDRPPTRGPAKAKSLRERKKRATRELISQIATTLFFERGFENVTVDEIAAAANVSRVTVFNYFTCKEDLLFDRTDYAQQHIAAALAERGRHAPVPTLRALAHDLVGRRDPLATVNASVASFWRVVADSPALRAHARAFAERLERDLGRLLAASVDAPTDDPVARLVAALLVGAWRSSFREALRQHRATRTAPQRETFLELLDRGFDAASVAAKGTPYV